MTTINSNKYTNFRMDRLLRDSQNENILPQQQPQNNFWPFTQNLSPNNILTTPTALITPLSPIQQQQQYLHSFQFPSPPFYNLSPNFSTFFSSPPSSSLNTNPFLTAFLTSLFQKQFILNQLQKQQITSIFQQNTPPSINSTPGTSNSENSWRTNNSSNNLTSFKYPNNNYPTTTKISKIVEKVAAKEKIILNKSSCKRKNENKELKETPKRRKINNILINNNNNNIQKVQCNVCGKSFGRPWLLNGHKRIHDGEKPFKCEEPGCSRSFADRSNCRAHEKTHRPEKPFVCEHCGKAFKLKSYLSKHSRVCRQQK